MKLSEKQLKHARLLFHGTGILKCPACGGTVQPRWERCNHCGFKGADTLALFPDNPPRLEPISDLAGLFSSSSKQKLQKSLKRVRHYYPQFHWYLLTAALPAETNLPVFGFWLLNAAPLREGETAEHRAWTVMVVYDSTSESAAVTCGYDAEPFVSDSEWISALQQMAPHMAAGNPALGFIHFLEKSKSLLRAARKRYPVQYSSAQSL